MLNSFKFQLNRFTLSRIIDTARTIGVDNQLNDNYLTAFGQTFTSASAPNRYNKSSWWRKINTFLFPKNKLTPHLFRSAKPTVTTVSVLLLYNFACNSAYSSTVFINELHYDNSGSDINEALEIAAISGTNLAGWQLLFYNGLNGTIYKTENLGGTISNQNNGFGVLSFTFSGIQNGPADAFALVDSFGSVVEFISYEGTVTGSVGAALGLTSTDIGIAEDSGSAIGLSLQRIGTGTQSNDFNWVQGDQSFGQINANQEFNAVAAVPLPAGFGLFAGACMGLIGCHRKRAKNRHSQHKPGNTEIVNNNGQLTLLAV